MEYKNYQQEVNVLRVKIVNSIIDLLKEHGLEELELSDNLDDLCTVVWFDNCENAYDSPVRKVSLYKNGISLHVEDEDTGSTGILYSHDSGCQNLDYLSQIYENMIDTLEKCHSE